MTTLIQKAEEIARRGHEGQFRSDGKPYFTHVEAVAKIAEELYPKYFDSEVYLHEVISVSLLHDLLEQTKITAEDLDKELATVIAEPRPIIMAVKLLTKVKDENWSYVTYLSLIKANPVAKLVKVADIRHNLSDLKQGNLRDKYELSLYFLET